MNNSQNFLKKSIQLYIKPLQANKLLSDQDMTLIFSDIETIVNVNKQVLRDIEKRMRQSKKIQIVGDLFMRMADFFKMYRTFCSVQGEALSRINELVKIDAVKNFFLVNLRGKFFFLMFKGM